MKELEEYKDGKLALALENAFLGFDKRLTEEKVLQELKEIAGINADEDEPGDGKGWFDIVGCTSIFKCNKKNQTFFQAL